MDNHFGTEAPQTPAAPPRRRALWLGVLAGVMALLLGVAAALLLLRGPAPRNVDTNAGQVAVVAPPAPPPAEVNVADAESNAQTLLAGLSGKLSGLLGTPDLLRKVVAAVQLASEGESWLHLFSPLRPSKPFEVIEKDNKTFVDPSSYARYDDIADAIASVDATKAAAAYSALTPALEQLYREVARPGARFSDALSKALSPVIHARISDDPVELAPKGAIWIFKDPALEGMDPTSKLMVRVGPANARKLQAAARAFAAAARL